MKKINRIYWISTLFILLFEGVMPALTSRTELAKEGIRHLGYPDYFGIILTIFKVSGSVLLIIPKIPLRIKEWAYAGFAFEFIFAFISTLIVDGLKIPTFLPLAVLAILIVSYIYYHKKTKPQPARAMR
jgi:hypothetical protein